VESSSARLVISTAKLLGRGKSSNFSYMVSKKKLLKKHQYWHRTAFNVSHLI
jgi:hypothetical protein